MEMNESTHTGRVFLVGAGPGDPGLLTLRAVECLQQADFVLHDYLTSTRTLTYARSGAEILCVDRLPGEHPQRWPVIHQRIIDEALKGKTVVHLKGGDPLIFGRGGEEAEAIRRAGIPYEIVPGITAALAAGAYAEIPLTQRGHASAIAFVTGHEHPGKANSQLDWEPLVRFPGTLALYMSVGRLGAITRELMARGRPGDTPVALVHNASSGGQKTIVGTLASIELDVRQAGITSPSLMLVGAVVDLKPAVSWFESRPLVGLRILITRPKIQAEEFARRLELLGAIPEILPVLDVGPPEDWSPADRAIEGIERDEFDWLIFTSANGVRAFIGRLFELEKDLRAMGRIRLGSIGSATTRALAGYHLVPDIAPSDAMHSEGLANLLGDHVRGKKIVLAQAAEGRELLRETLTQFGSVERIAVYRQVECVEPDSPIFDQLRRGEVDIVTLTSPNIARTLLNACDRTILDRMREGSIRLVVNSDRLQHQLESDGFRVWSSASPTEDGLIEAIQNLDVR